MIVVRIKEVANKKGVKSGYQFQKLTGFAPAMAERVYNGNWRRIDTKTLNTICNALNCTPNEILHFTPDPE
jgi:DNA-binding Xre family transcriptional regulator